MLRPPETPLWPPLDPPLRDGLRGGWNLRLLENGEEVGGGGYWKEAGSVETDREALSVSAQ